MAPIEKLRQTELSVRGILHDPVSLWVSWNRRLFSFSVVLTCSLVYLVFILARRNIADPDLRWHLRNAQQLVTQAHFPTVDNYSYSAAGAPVLPFEWIAELPFYFAFTWFGFSGVFFLVFVLCSAIVLGVFRLSYIASQDIKNSFVVTVGATILGAVSIGARTLLFGWLFLVLLMLLLESFRRNDWKWICLVPPLFCVWVNSHGSWPMGIAVFSIFLLSGLVEGDLGNTYAIRWSRPQLHKLLLAYAASVGAVFVNPFGSRLVLYPFKVMLGIGAGPGKIQEFASVDFQTSWGKVALVLILGTLSVAVLSRERWRLDELACTMLALTYSLMYVRFLFLAAILISPVFARRTKLMSAYDRSLDRRLPNVIALAVLTCLLVVSWPRHAGFRNAVDYPAGAVAYLKASGIQSRIFNDYVWGGYLIWNAPELKVFIDGRGDPYGPPGVFNDYIEATSNENSQRVFDKYKVQYVLMSPDSPVARQVAISSMWTVRFRDEVSVLFERSAPL